MNGANKITKLVLSLLMTISCINFSTVQAEDSEPAATAIPAEEVIAEPTPTTEGSADEVLPTASPEAEVTAVPELVEDKNSNPEPTAEPGTEGEGTVVPATVPTEEPVVEQHEETVKDYSENILFDANTDITYNEDYTVAFVTMKLDTEENVYLDFLNAEAAIQNDENVSVNEEQTSLDQKTWVLNISKNGEYTFNAIAVDSDTMETVGAKDITVSVSGITEKTEEVTPAPEAEEPSVEEDKIATIADSYKEIRTIKVNESITLYGSGYYSHKWTSKNSKIAKVSGSGSSATVTGVAKGETVITHEYKTYFGDTKKEKYKITVTEEAQKLVDAYVFMQIDPEANPDSNGTAEWLPKDGYQDPAFKCKIDVSNAHWETISGSTLNIRTGVAQRVVSWPSAAPGGVLPKTNALWSQIVENYKTAMEMRYGYTITADDVLQITLVPYKISHPSSGYHLDCKVDIQCKDIYTALFNLQDAGTESFAQYGNGVTVKAEADGTATVPSNRVPYSPATKTVDGITYEFDGWYRNSECTGDKVTFPDQINSNTTYYGRYVARNLSVTVNYYLNGTTEKVAESKVVGGKLAGEEVTESPLVIDGYTPVSTESKTETAGLDKSIDFYYYKNVTLTANSDTKTYTGTEQSVEGYTSSETSATFERIVAKGSGTDAGTYPVTFAHDPVNTVSTDGKYIVTGSNPGTLTITPITEEQKVKITGNTATHTFDGNEYSVEGFTTDRTDITVTLNAGKEAKATGTNAGKYQMGLTKEDFTATSGNYTNITIEVEDGYLEITPDDTEKVVKITGNKDAVPFDGNEHTVNGYAADLPEGYAETDFRFTGTAEAKGTDAGTYNMHLAADQFTNLNGNYSNVVFEVEDGVLTITKKSMEDEDSGITITNPADTMYNGTSQKLEPTVYDSKTNRLLEKDKDYYLDYSEDTTNAGTVTIKITGAGNYSGMKFASYKITQRTVILTSEDDSKPYDGTPLTKPTVKVTGDGFVKGEVEDIKATGTITNVGSVENTITYTRLDKFKESNYIITEEKGTLTIEARRVTVTAKNSGKVFGKADPALEAEVRGVINGESVGLIQYTLRREPGETVGDYPITVSGNEKQGNYVVTYNPATFTITKSGEITLIAELAGEAATKVYDGNPLTGGAKASVTEGTTITYSTDGGTTWTTEVPSITNVGTLDITAKAENPNYTPVETTYTLTVTQRPVTVTADAKSKTYGDADPELTATKESTVGDDTVDYELTREPGENVGTYLIHVTGEASQGNYSVTFEDGTLTITKADTLEIEAELTGEDASKVYDGEPLTGGATASVTEGTTITYSTDGENWTTEVPSITNVGELNLRARAENPNYTPVETIYTLTVTQRPVTVTADDKSKTYGDADPELTATTEGAVGDDLVDYELTREPGEDVGTYPIHVTGEASQGNYSVTFEDGTLTITKAGTLEIEAELTGEDASEGV